MAATAKFMKDGKFIMLTGVRCDWPAFFSVPDIGGEEGRIGCKGMLKKGEDDEAILFLEKAIAAVAREHNPNKETEGKFKGKGKRLPTSRICLADGDDSEKDKYNGHRTINLQTKRTFGKNDEGDRVSIHEPCFVIGADGKRTTNPMQRPVFYSGCYVTVKISLWFQDNKEYGKRVNATLHAVQFHKEGEALSQDYVSDEDAIEGFGETEFASAENDADTFGEEEMPDNLADDDDNIDF